MASRPVVPAHQRLVVEALESRLLLNADVLALDLSQSPGHVAQDHQLLVQLVQDTTQTQANSVAVQNVQIVDQSNGNAVLAFGALKDISAISINTGNGNNTVTVDANSFKSVLAPSISLQGGDGQNNLVFDTAANANTQWTLDGKDSGKVDSNGLQVQFNNFENLTGAANNQDTLTVEQGGKLSGMFDGGAGGFDTLTFDNGPHQSAVYDPTGPDSGTITVDGDAFKFVGLEPILLGTTTHVTLSTGGSANLDTNGGGLKITGAGEEIDFSGAEEITLQGGATLHVAHVGQISLPGDLTIDGNAGSVVFEHDVATAGHQLSVTTQSIEVGSNVQITGGGVINLAATSIGTTSSNASLLIDSGAVISGSSVTLGANATSSSTLTGNSSTVTANVSSAAQATVDIAGQITGTSSVVISSSVVNSITVTNANGSSYLGSVINATDTSTVTIESGAVITGGSVQVSATTNLTINVAVGNVSTPNLSGFTPPVNAQAYIDSIVDGSGSAQSAIGHGGVNIAITVANTTSITEAKGASIVALTGAGTVGMTATDTTAIDVTLTMNDAAVTSHVPIVNGVLLFSASDINSSVTRDTEVAVGNVASPAVPLVGATKAINAAGAVSLGATSNGHVKLKIVSDEVGTIENSADDTTLVAIGSVPLTVQGLSLAALSDTDYFSSAQAVKNTLQSSNVLAATGAFIIDSTITAGSGGVSLTAEDDSTLTALAISSSFPVTRLPVPTFALSRSSAVTVADKEVDAKISGSTVTSGGAVIVQAVRKMQVLGSASSESIDYTSVVPATAYSISMAGTYVVNEILGSVLATVDTSSVSTTSGGVAVQAADASLIDAEATAGATALGGASSLAVGGAIALNAIGLKAGSNLATATVDALLGTSFFSDATRPAKVGATIVNSVVTPAGALVLTALGNSLINATVTNISSATGTAPFGNSARAAGVILSTNKVNRSTTASIDNSTTPSNAITGGTGVTLDAEDNASIQSNSKIVASSQATSTGAAKYVQQGLDYVLPHTFVASNTAARPTFGQTVLLQADYNTSPGLFPLSNSPTNVQQITRGDIVEVSKGLGQGRIWRALPLRRAAGRRPELRHDRSRPRGHDCQQQLAKDFGQEQQHLRIHGRHAGRDAAVAAGLHRPFSLEGSAGDVDAADRLQHRDDERGRRDRDVCGQRCGWWRLGDDHQFGGYRDVR